MLHSLAFWKRSDSRKYAGIIALCTFLFFISNPELLSLILLVNVIGLDIFMLLLSIQLRSSFSAGYLLYLVPLYHRVISIFRSKNVDNDKLDLIAANPKKEEIYAQSVEATDD